MNEETVSLSESIKEIIEASKDFKISPEILTTIFRMLVEQKKIACTGEKETFTADESLVFARAISRPLEMKISLALVGMYESLRAEDITGK